jgi:hypothetical protein
MAPPSILVGRFHDSNHMLAKSDVRDAAAGCTFAATLGWRPYDQLHGIDRLVHALTALGSKALRDALPQPADRITLLEVARPPTAVERLHLAKALNPPVETSTRRPLRIYAPMDTPGMQRQLSPAAGLPAKGLRELFTSRWAGRCAREVGRVSASSTRNPIQSRAAWLRCAGAAANAGSAPVRRARQRRGVGPRLHRPPVLPRGHLPRARVPRNKQWQAWRPA